MQEFKHGRTEMRLAILICWSSVLFLILGNLPRMVPALGGAFNWGEVLWLLSASTLGLYFMGAAISIRMVTVLVSACVLSLCVGLIKFGFSGEALIYNVRLIGQIVGGAIFGRALWVVYGSNVSRLSRGIVVVYTVLALVSFGLFALFPDTSQLWRVMQESGVDYQGDPHNGRLISPYFDPNFYSCIIVLPILFAWVATRSWRLAWVCMAIMMVSLLMTVSRSGIALLFAVVLLLLLRNFGAVARARFSYGFLLSIFVGVGGVLAGGFVFSSFVDRAISRFDGVQQDGSALARVRSFEIGNALIAEQPVLGFGYNYVIDPARKIRGGKVGLDSSIQVFVASFGIPAAVWLFVMVVAWFSRIRKRLAGEALLLCGILLMYCAFTVLVAGNFNQILFYPFWIIPVTGLISYFHFLAFARKPQSP